MYSYLYYASIFMVTCHFIWYDDNDVISYISQYTDTDTHTSIDFSPGGLTGCITA